MFIYVYRYVYIYLPLCCTELTVGRPCAAGEQFSIDYGAALRTVYDIYLYDIYLCIYIYIYIYICMYICICI